MENDLENQEVDPFFYGEDQDDFTKDIGKMTSKLRATTVRWFNKWLASEPRRTRDSFDNLRLGDITEELFGKFTGHLFRHVGLETCLAYLSHFKMVVLEKFPRCTIFQSSEWYTSLRVKIVNRYYAKADTTDEDVRRSSLSMSQEDIAFACEILLSGSTSVSRQSVFTGYDDRAIIIWDRHFAGRIQETGSLTAGKVGWVSKHRCLMVCT
jgi:hypothetical protein